MVDIKYIYRTTLIHPWVAVGFAGQSFQSSEIAEGVKYTWRGTNNSIYYGVGIDTGKELGWGFNLSAYYMPFGKEKTEIKIDDNSQKSSRKIDFSLIKISLGIHYSFNL